MAVPLYGQPVLPQGIQFTDRQQAVNSSQPATAPGAPVFVKALPRSKRSTSRTQRKRNQTKKMRQKAVAEGMSPEQYDLRHAEFEAFTPEEQKTALQAAVGGLATGAEIALSPLDVPGSTVRETIGLLSTGDFSKYNPLTAIASPFSYKNREDGRDVLRDIPLVNQIPMFKPDGEDTWKNFTAGLAFEIGTDPLTYLSGGFSALPKIGSALLRKAAKTSVGKVAKKASQRAARTLVERTPDALKPTIKKAAEGVASRGKSYYTRGKEIATGLFDYHARGSWYGRGQKFSQGLSREIDEIESVVRGQIRRYEDELAKAGFDLSSIADRNEFLKSMEDPIIRDLERKGVPINEHVFRLRPNASPQAIKAAPIFNEMYHTLTQLLGDMQRMGYPVNKLQDVIPYFPRQKERVPETIMGMLNQLRGSAATALGFRREGSLKIDLRNPNIWGRDKKFKVGREGTELVNRMTSDPEIVGVLKLKDNPMSHGQLAQKILQKYGSSLPPYFIKNSLDEFAAYVGSLGRDLIEKGGLFATNPLANLEKALVSGQQGLRFLKQLNAEVQQEFAPKFDEIVDAMATGAYDKLDDLFLGDPEKHIPFKELVNTLGLDEDKFTLFVLEKYLPESLPNLRDPQALANKLDEISQNKAMLDMFKQVPIEKRFAKDLERIIVPFTAPKERNPILQFLHDLTTIQKLALTGHFPGFHSRNFTGAQVNNVMMGNFGEKIWEAIPEGVRSNWDTRKLLLGQEIPGISQWDLFKPHKLSDREATDALLTMAYDSGVLHNSHMLETTETLQRATDIMNPVYGRPVESANIKDILRMNDKGRNAVKTYLKTWGSNASDTVESFARLAPFISMVRRKGKDYVDREFFEAMAALGKEAKDRVTFTQVDYSDLTPAEKEGVRLLFPFYSFAKGMTKAVTKELWDKPGGNFARMIRVQARAGEQDEKDILTSDILPDHVRRGGAIELGRTEDDTSRILSSFGLMHEQPIEALSNPEATTLGMLNPIPKYFIELSTGRSLYFDEPLTQLTPNIGRTLANVNDIVTGEQTHYPKPFISSGFEQFVQASPASRYLTTARTLTDKRKWSPKNLGILPIPPVMLNTLTGVKITDVNAQQKSFASRDAVRSPLIASGARTRKAAYIPKKMTIDRYQGSLLSLQHYLQRLEQKGIRKRKKQSLVQRGL